MYKSPSRHRQSTLFWDLETMLDSRNPLFKLANLVDWSAFEAAFSPLFSGENGLTANTRAFARKFYIKQTKKQ